MKAIFKILACCVLALPLIGHTQASYKRVDEIMRTVISVDGHLDRDMHREFWSALKEWDRRETEQLLALVNANILMAQEYQQELWQSALISYRYRKVVKTERLIQLEVEFPTRIKKSLSLNAGSSENTKYIETINRRLALAMENSKNLLISASQHTALHGVAGEVIEIDEARIVHVLEGIKGSVDRLMQLLNADWKE